MNHVSSKDPKEQAPESHDPDEVLRRMLNTPPEKKDKPKKKINRGDSTER